MRNEFMNSPHSLLPYQSYITLFATRPCGHKCCWASKGGRWGKAAISRLSLVSAEVLEFSSICHSPAPCSGVLSCLCSSHLWSSAAAWTLTRLQWRKLCGERFWEVRILLLLAAFKFKHYPQLCYVADMPVTVYVLYLSWSCPWPTDLTSWLGLQTCFTAMDFSGHLADLGYSYQSFSVTLAQGLWHCSASWGHCPSYLGPPLAHVPLQSSPLFLLPDPGMGIFRNGC